jgi:hypothetical protein
MDQPLLLAATLTLVLWGVNFYPSLAKSASTQPSKASILGPATLYHQIPNPEKMSRVGIEL